MIRYKSVTYIQAQKIIQQLIRNIYKNLQPKICMNFFIFYSLSFTIFSLNSLFLTQWMSCSPAYSIYILLYSIYFYHSGVEPLKWRQILTSISGFPSQNLFPFQSYLFLFFIFISKVKIHMGSFYSIKIVYTQTHAQSHTLKLNFHWSHIQLY